MELAIEIVFQLCGKVVEAADLAKENVKSSRLLKDYVVAVRGALRSKVESRHSAVTIDSVQFLRSSLESAFDLLKEQHAAETSLGNPVRKGNRALRTAGRTNQEFKHVFESLGRAVDTLSLGVACETVDKVHATLLEDLGEGLERVERPMSLLAQRQQDDIESPREDLRRQRDDMKDFLERAQNAPVDWYRKAADQGNVLGQGSSSGPSQSLDDVPADKVLIPVEKDEQGFARKYVTREQYTQHYGPDKTAEALNAEPVLVRNDNTGTYLHKFQAARVTPDEIEQLGIESVPEPRRGTIAAEDRKFQTPGGTRYLNDVFTDLEAGGDKAPELLVKNRDGSYSGHWAKETGNASLAEFVRKSRSEGATDLYIKTDGNSYETPGSFEKNHGLGTAEDTFRKMVAAQKTCSGYFKAQQGIYVSSEGYDKLVEQGKAPQKDARDGLFLSPKGHALVSSSTLKFLDKDVHQSQLKQLRVSTDGARNYDLTKPDVLVQVNKYMLVSAEEARKAAGGSNKPLSELYAKSDIWVQNLNPQGRKTGNYTDQWSANYLARVKG